jgi:hypothetical protein
MLYGHQFGSGLAGLRNDNFFATCRGINKSGEMSLCIVEC